MRALDSHVLIRYLTKDDSAQTPVAIRFIETQLTSEDPGYVSLPVLCELVWSLRRAYGFPAAAVAAAVRRLLETSQLVVAEEPAVEHALSSPADLVDAIVHELGRAAGCSETVTFDRNFARIEGARLLRSRNAPAP